MKITKERAISILLVDDDTIDRELFIDAISALSIKCTVTEASGGNEALERLKEQKPTMVMLDLNMPMKDGRQTLRKSKPTETLKTFPSSFFQPPTHSTILPNHTRLEPGCSLKNRTILRSCQKC